MSTSLYDIFRLYHNSSFPKDFMTYWQAFIFQSDIKHDVYGLLMTHAYLLQHNKKSQNSDVIKDFKILFVFHAGHVFQQKHFSFQSENVFIMHAYLRNKSPGVTC